MPGNLNVGEQNALSVHEATDELIGSDIDATGTSFTDVLFPSTYTSHFNINDNNVNPKVTTNSKRKRRSIEVDDSHRFLELEEKK